VTSAAPKTRPLISGETTIAELAVILRAHGVIWVEVDCNFGKWTADFDGTAQSPRLDTLHEALGEALLDLRLADPESFDLTPDEAAS
jgi:hypothetical protein